MYVFLNFSSTLTKSISNFNNIPGNITGCPTMVPHLFNPIIQKLTR